MALFQSAVLNNYLARVCNSLFEADRWMEYYNEQKAKADNLKSPIAKTDSEIDAMVYELYGLSEEVVRVVEGKF